MSKDIEQLKKQLDQMEKKIDGLNKKLDTHIDKIWQVYESLINPILLDSILVISRSIPNHITLQFRHSFDTKTACSSHSLSK